MASRNTSNRLVEQLDSGAHRETVGNVGPAVESANARVDLVGPFRTANIAINQSSVPMTAVGVGTDAQVGIVAHSSGKIIGMTWKFTAAVAAGGATAAQLQANIAPAATLTPAVIGDVFSVASGAGVPSTAGLFDESAEVAFAKGDSLGVNLSTSGTFAPTTTDLDVYLIVRWNASPGVPA